MATTVGTIQLLATIDTSRYKQGEKEIEKSNANIEKSSDQASKKTAAFWSRGMSQFSGAAQVATSAVIASIGLMARTFINSASEIQSLRASFESLTGSTEDTNKVMESLYNLGRETAFDNKDIQAAGRSYLAAGVAVEDLQEVLRATGDIAGATGANLAQLTLPLTQTIARGKLQTQDFYQILNSGAGALRKPLTELAGRKGFGSLAEALEKGAITSDDLLQVMQDVTKEGGFAFQGAIKQSETFNGRMSNLREAITNVGLSILGVDAVTGEVDPSGPFARLSNAVSTATNFLVENEEVIKQVGTVIGVFLVPAIIRLGVQGLLAGTRLAAGILLALGPIGLIVAAVSAAALLIIKNWDTVKGWLSSFWNWIKENWDTILVVLTGGVGLAAVAIIRNFDKIKSAVGNVWNWIKGVFGTIGEVAATIIKAPVNAIIGFAEKTINGFIRAINGAIGAINRIPGVNIGTLGEINIPKLANGGIVTSPTLAMVGEGGESEAVIPLSKLDQMLAAERVNNTDNSSITINLQGVFATSPAEQRRVAEQIAQRLKEIQASRGLAGGIA